MVSVPEENQQYLRYIAERNTLGEYSLSGISSVVCLVPRYFHTDAERYDYSVKYPDYLTFTGNLCVGLPAEGDDPFTDFLVIWPKAFGGCEYGVSLREDDAEYQIYIRADGSAVRPEDQALVDRHRQTVEALLQRAEEMWDLKESYPDSPVGFCMKNPI